VSRGRDFGEIDRDASQFDSGETRHSRPAPPRWARTGRWSHNRAPGMVSVSVYLLEIRDPRDTRASIVVGQSGASRSRWSSRACSATHYRISCPPEDLQAWGWRIPLIVGCLIIPFIYRPPHPQETEDSRRGTPSDALGDLRHACLVHWRIVIAGVRMVIMTPFRSITITATPRRSQEHTQLSESDALLVTLCVGL